MIAKVITLLNDKIIIQIVLKILEYLVKQSDNKLDDEVLQLVQQRLQESGSA